MQLPFIRRLTACLCAVVLLAASAEAAVRLEVEGVGGQLAENIRAHIGEPPGSAGGALRAFQSRAAEDAEQALRALGHYNAQIQVSREPRGEDVIVRVRVEAGPRVELARVDMRVRGAAEHDTEFQSLLARLPLRTGAGLNHGEYEASKSALLNLAQRRGYFDARFAASRVAVDAVDNTAAVTLHFDSGPRYSMGSVSFPDTPFTEELLARLVPYEAGDPYESELVARFNRNLLDSGYFSEVRLLPQPGEGTGTEVPVDVELAARDPNRIGIGVGASTDTGPRLRLSWDRHWVNRYGHKLFSDLELAQVRQGLQTRYQVPLEDAVNDMLEFQFGFRVEEFDDPDVGIVDSERFTAQVQRQQYLGSGWRRTLSYRWERNRFDNVEDETLLAATTTTLFIPGIGWSRVRSRGGIDPSWGDRQLYNVEGTHPLLGSDIELLRARVGLRVLRPFGERHRILLRADGGALLSESFNRVPPALRFYAGGDQSVRGFGYRDLGPGRFMLTGSAEYGYRFHESWRLAAFVDAGNAVMRLVDWEPAVGTGFGVHWISPVGPIRIDFAWGISEEDPPFRLHFSLGAQL